MTPPEFDAFLRRVAALRPDQRNIHGWLTKQGKAAGRKALAGLVVPEGLTELQCWHLARVKAYVRGDESGRWVPADPEDPMEQMLVVMARCNNAEREHAIACQYRPNSSVP